MPHARTVKSESSGDEKPYSKPAAKKATPKKSKNPTNKKQGAWSAEELKTLYQVMCPKRVGVKWDEVASAIPGRDAKSCNNKWSRIQGKILEAVMALGDA